MTSPDNPVHIAWTTVETADQARALATLLVEKRLVACAQISGPITSIYPWKNHIESAAEYRVALKFPASREQEILEVMNSAHPYEVPQWVSIPVAGIHAGYEKWIRDSTSA